MSSKIEDNEEAILRGESYEPIGYERMFMILKSKYQEPDGAPIVRPKRQLGEIGKAIARELEVGVRNPVGVWDLLGGKRMESGSPGSNLACREMYIYSKDCNIAKSHIWREVIERHCVSLEYVEDLQEPNAAKIPGEVSKLHKGNWGTFECRVYRKTIRAIGCLR